ncbi:MAG: DUF3106 domain-containing protein [Terriglobales bacterium]
MKLRLQIGWLAVLGLSALMALPSAAQHPRAHWAQDRQADRPPKQQKRQERQQPRQQERRQPQQESHKAQTERRNAQPPRHAEPPRNSLNNNPPPGSANSHNAGNRPPNATVRPRDFSPEERQRLQQNQRRFSQLPPQQQQELRERAQVWQKLTPDQRQHIRNDVLPKWKQLPTDRQRAIRQRLGVLQNMPESARNQHLNDPNFMRGMSEEDKAMLHDLSHLHVGGAPEPPNE